MLQPGDAVRADRGFKIEDILGFYQCSLFIPPSCHSDLQMTRAAVQQTSRIANLRIFVEKAIARIKKFRLLKFEVPVTLMQSLDDILTVAAVLTNMDDPSVD